MKKHFRKGAFRWASLILTVVMAINLLPLTAMAEGTDPWYWSSGSGSSDDPFVGLISSQEDLDAAEAKINDNDVNNRGKYYTVSLLADIACTNSFNVSRNNITLLGNGHTLDFSNINNAMNITGKDTVLSLGNSNSSGTPSRLTIIGNPNRNGDPFICVSSYASGKDYGTLKMYDGVTITGAVGDTTFGGAVTVGSAGYFEMNGGTIQNCGIRGGSVCYGGGVAVINGGSFVMNGGTIQNCFLKQGYSHPIEDYNVFFNYCAGAGVFVNNRSYFKMTGGEIKNNEISTNAGVGAYGVGGGIAIIGDSSSYAVGSRVDITSGRITGNKATLGGAGIAICGLQPRASALANPDNRYADELANPGLYISGGTINDNHADGNSNYGFGGGGILIYHLNYGDTYSNNVNIKNARITGNTVDNGPGGGIASLHLSSGFQNEITIENCDITNNHALWGGGICMRNDSNTSKMNTAVNGSILTGNAASGDLGGGISVEGTGVDKTTLQFDSDCAIYDNTSTVGAADLFMKDSTVKNLSQAMTAENGKTYAWYWDYETIADTTYEYPAGIQNPCDRYSDDNRVAYTAIPSETEMRYLKAAESGYTVTFDLNYAGADASTAPSAQTVYSGETAQEPVAPARDDYEFAGWYKDALCTQRYDFSSPVTANITLYAKWVQRLPPSGGTGGSGGGTSAYTLRYQSNGGTPCPDETKTSAWSKDYDSLPVPVREGYLFTGWFADSGLQTPISEDVQVNRRLVTIYAGWEKSMVPAMLNGDDHYAYVQGYSDGTVRPNDNITRAEVATIFFRLLKDEIREENLSDVNTFEDVTDGMWCNKAISTMAVLGVVKGRTAEYFDPDAPITRGEFAAICSRFDKSDIVARENFTDIEGYWAKEEIERAAILGWVRGYTDGSFRPRNYITRAEAMTMINRVLHRVPESPEDLLPDMVTWPDNKLTDWYYLAVQEATNSHIPERKVNGYESWFALTDNRDWSIYQS